MGHGDKTVGVAFFLFLPGVGGPNQDLFSLNSLFTVGTGIRRWDGTG